MMMMMLRVRFLFSKMNVKMSVSNGKVNFPAAEEKSKQNLT